VNIILLGRLLGQHKCLSEAPHGSTIIGELACDLNDHSIAKSSLRVHLLDFGMAVIEIKLGDAVVDLPLANNRLSLMVGIVKASVDKRGVFIVKAASKTIF